MVCIRWLRFLVQKMKGVNCFWVGFSIYSVILKKSNNFNNEQSLRGLMVLQVFTCWAEVRGLDLCEPLTHIHRKCIKNVLKSVSKLALGCAERGSSCRAGLIRHWFLQVDPAEERRKLFLWAGTTAPVFLSNLPVFLLVHSSDFIGFRICLCPQKKVPGWQCGERGRKEWTVCYPRKDSGQFCRPHLGWELVEPWLCAEGMADLGDVLVGSWIWAWKALPQVH